MNTDSSAERNGDRSPPRSGYTCLVGPRCSLASRGPARRTACTLDAPTSEHRDQWLLGGEVGAESVIAFPPEERTTTMEMPLS